MRKKVIAGNWKMYKTQAEAAEFLAGFIPHLEDTPDEREVVLCVPFTDLTKMSQSLHGSSIRLGAQTFIGKLQARIRAKSPLPC